MGYESVLLKLSGEALSASGDAILDRGAIDTIAAQIRDVTSTGVRLAVVGGAGSLLRGRDVPGAAQT